MKLIGRDILDELSKNHADSRSACSSLVKEIEEADWKKPQDIKDRYRSASFLADNTVIINVKGNSYRVELFVAYQTGVVMVKWAGTHAEYSKR